MTSSLLRRGRGPVAALATAALLAACSGGDDTAEVASTGTSGSPQEVTVQHAQGETTVPVEPETVIAFDMSAVDTLTELGVEVDGLPKSHLPEFLSSYEGEEYVDAGTLFEPDYEAVNAAEPDLIIVGGRSAAAYPQLAEIAPTIDLTADSGDWLGSLRESTTTLGQVFGRQAEAQAALAELDAAIAETREVTAEAGDGLVVLTNAGEVTAYGPGSRFGMLHDVLGVEPADPDIEVASHGEAVSFEYVLETNPDWLFVVDRDAAVGSGSGAAQQVLDNAIIQQTSAWRDDQVVYLDPVRWYIVGNGLGSAGEMVDQIRIGLS